MNSSDGSGQIRQMLREEFRGWMAVGSERARRVLDLVHHLSARSAASARPAGEWLRTRASNDARYIARLSKGYLRRAKKMLRFADLGAAGRFQPTTGIILAFGGIAAAGGYFAINDYGIAPVQHELNRVAGEVSSSITRSVDRHVAVAESAGALFSGPRANVTRWSFFEYARTLPSKNPGLNAIEWIPRVSGRERRKFEQSATADGLFDFHFMERTEDGRRIIAAQRTEHFPVYYVEPYAGNEAILGLDLAANEQLAGVLAQVRDTGKTMVHWGAMLSGDTDIPNFSVVVPVYRSGAVPFTVAERRNALLGFIHASFRFDRLLRALRAGIGGLPPLEVYIFNRSDDNDPSLIYFATSQGNRGETSVNARDAYQGLYHAVDHEVAGRRWSIVVKPVQGLFQAVIGFAAWGFVIFVLLLTSLLLRHVATMRVAREQAETANRAKSEFLAMMSHELRTPLNSVIGFSDMMLHETFGPLSNEHYEQYTGHINRSAAHLLGLINTILDLSKIEAGYYTIEKEDFRLRDVWDAVFPMLQAAIQDSGVDVDGNLSKSPLTLHADPGVFRQIIHNLVSNALKFTPKGGRVGVTAAVAPDGRFSLRVADTGIGIAEENLGLVLLPFRQVDNSLSRNYDGIGLGLPLTCKLVEIHGGALRIDSKLGEGTVVTADFPPDIIVAVDASRNGSAGSGKGGRSADPPAAPAETKEMASAG